MNDNEKEIKNSDLAEAKNFDDAIASRDAIIDKKNETIKILKHQLGEKEKFISKQIEDLDNEKTARIEAENKVAQQKELKIEHKGNYYKTEEEKFADEYKKACEKLRGK